MTFRTKFAQRAPGAIAMAALLTACALPAPRVKLAPTVVTESQIARLVATTEREWERWGRKIVRSEPGKPTCLVVDDDGDGAELCEPVDDGCGDEQTPELCPLVHSYWALLPPGISHHSCGLMNVCKTTWPAGDPRAPERTSPWSAAFVSAMLARAGFTPGEFWPSSTHAGYISAARELFASAFEVVPTPAAPAAGDIVCATRADTQLTPADIGQIGVDGPALHCDIVVRVDAQAQVLHAIGGNVQQTVARTMVPLDGSGELQFDASSDRPWILVLKARGGPMRSRASTTIMSLKEKGPERQLSATATPRKSASYDRHGAHRPGAKSSLGAPSPVR